MTAHASSGDASQLKLGRYEIVRELGKGAMGVVYLAKDPLIGRLVALKTIRAAAHAEDDETREFQQRFIREAQAAGILNHPAIVTVHDIGLDEDSGTNFIAMEYVEGANLKEVLAQGRALSFDQIGEIIAQVGEALDFAHTKGIVHRDVKPANVILLDGMRAKITDFGIAKIASGAGGNLTSTGQFLGTPNYMAPEQIKGAPVDGRTDIFSLGICLYECLTRRKPFGGDSLTSISYKIVHEPFPPLREQNPQIPEGFEEVVATCLAKDPAKRYQRARDLANALRAVIRGERPVRPNDPVLAEETMVTRDSGRMPTLDVPFPAAEELPGDVGGSTRPAAGAMAAAVAPSASGGRMQPIRNRVHRTLTNVRAYPAWRRRIPPALFVGILAILVAGLIGAVAAIRSRHVPVPAVDTAAEARRARERQLRHEANELMRQGNVAGAYTKYEELNRLSPNSPHVTATLQKLNAILQQTEISKQQRAQAKQKLDEGILQLNAKKYDAAIQLLQESFSLNPNSNETAAYLKLAQIEKQHEEEVRRARQGQQPTPLTRGTTTTTNGVTATTQTTAPTAPTQLTTTFTHPFSDGRIIVRAGGDIVANETLFEQKRGGILRRATNVPRPVAVTHSFPSKNADLEVWVTVPTQKITEHHRIAAFRFEPGATHRLVVRYDRASKKFSYELN